MLRLFRRAIVRVSLASALALAGPGAAVALEAPDVSDPALPRTAESAEGFVPPGWVVEVSETGDLNQDGRPDLLLVFRQDDPANVVENEPDSPGVRELDTNPRILAVAFAQKKGGFALILENHEFIPRYDTPTIDDPFSGADITDGAICIHLHYWANAGSWYTSDTIFIFKYRSKAFRLVGLGEYTTKRNTGETWELSVDFVARKAELTLGSFSDDDVEDQTYWKSLPRSPLLAIDDIGCGWDFTIEPRDISWWGLAESSE